MTEETASRDLYEPSETVIISGTDKSAVLLLNTLSSLTTDHRKE
jgi:hypothetical protein